jgi:hypothetical protein
LSSTPVVDILQTKISTFSENLEFAEFLTHRDMDTGEGMMAHTGTDSHSRTVNSHAGQANKSSIMFAAPQEAEPETARW